ncbi:uncharacterized protein SCHCODRAFT_02568293 [Schizophyllum commune H4-8]|nr:uncharacterized protein SCHCODRAFT_02568293 [Schizophyllum commune H4-8]KAI5896111.1 hypothetical protein SCHCODRAFT_02568293 [Schizophyllum commune H4-8]
MALIRSRTHFLRLPDESTNILFEERQARAAEETRLHGAQTAICNAWCRDYFFPAAERVQGWVNNSEVDEAHAAMALAFSRNWITFEAHLHDTSSFINSNAVADRHTVLAPLGLFWEKFYALYESGEDRRVEDSPFYIKELDPALLCRLHAWFEDLDLRFQSMDDMFLMKSTDESQEGSPADSHGKTDRRRYWNIFLAGLARSLASDTDRRLKVPSPSFREKLEWKARFPILDKDLNGVKYVRDPITLGGAVGLVDPDILLTGDAKSKTEYLLQNMCRIIDIVLDDYKLGDAAAEQAMCTFLEMHSFQW